jgi:uncharacterized protein YggE
MASTAQKFALAFAASLTVTPAFAAGVPPPRVITVAGHGEINATPDSASVSAGVTTQSATAATALSDNAAAMNRVLEALKNQGVQEKNIQTSNFSVSPQYTPYNSNGTGAQKIVGYLVSNQVSVTLEHVTNVGRTVDALVAAGANQMNGISFTIHDPKPLLAQARAAAVDDARARAETFAKAAHVTLGPILSIGEAAIEEPRPLFAMQAMAKSERQPTPVAAGEQTVSADVSIVWQIQ